MSKDKVESRTERKGWEWRTGLGTNRSYIFESGDNLLHAERRAEHLAAHPSVPAQGEMLNFIDWVKSDKVTDNPESKIFDAYGQYCYALAASRSEAQPPQEVCGLPKGHHIGRTYTRPAFELEDESEAGAPAAGSAERVALIKIRQIACTMYPVDKEIKAIINDALAGTDTDVAKEK